MVSKQIQSNGESLGMWYALEKREFAVRKGQLVVMGE